MPGGLYALLHLSHPILIRLGPFYMAANKVSKRWTDSPKNEPDDAYDILCTVSGTR